MRICPDFEILRAKFAPDTLRAYLREYSVSFRDIYLLLDHIHLERLFLSTYATEFMYMHETCTQLNVSKERIKQYLHRKISNSTMYKSHKVMSACDLKVITIQILIHFFVTITNCDKLGSYQLNIT